MKNNSSNQKFKFKSFYSYNDLSSYVVNLLEEFLQAKTSNKDRIIIMPGGKSPIKLYEIIKSKQFDWSGITILLSDERLVKHNDINSNYALINKFFSNGEKIPKILPDMKDFVKGKEKEFLQEMNLKLKKMPKAALSFFGVGFDGHIASIFSNSCKISNVEEPFFLTKKKNESFSRISLSERYILELKKKFFLVLGENKKNIIKKIDINDNSIPVNRILNNSQEEVIFLTDIQR